MLDSIIYGVSGGIALLLLGYILIQRGKSVFWASLTLALIPIGFVDRFFISFPSVVKWLPFFGLLALGLICIVLSSRSVRIPRYLLWIYGFIILISILSLALNRTTFLSLVFEQRGYIMFFAFMIIMKVVFDQYSKDELFSFLLYAGLFSVVMALFQRVVLVHILAYHSGDIITGLFSYDGAYLFFQLFCLVVSISFWLYDHKLPNWPIPMQWTVFIFMAGIAIANNKAGFVFLAFIMLFVTYQVGWKVVRQRFGRLIIGAGLLMMGYLVFDGVYNSSYNRGEDDSYAQTIRDPNYWIEYLFGDGTEKTILQKTGSLKRGAAIVFAYDLIQKSPTHTWFGLGPGSTSLSKLRGAEGYLNKRYPNYRIGRTSLSCFLAETGYMGVLLNSLFLLGLLFWRPPGNGMDPAHHRLVRLAFILTCGFYLFYENLYHDPLLSLLMAVVLYPIIAPQSQENFYSRRKTNLFAYANFQ